MPIIIIKRAVLLKLLIDVFYVLNVIPVIVLFYVSINPNIKPDIKDLIYINHLAFAMAATSAVMFVIGVYYLRRVARNMLNTKQKLSLNTSSNLKKTGLYFVYSGLIYFIAILIKYGYELYVGELELSYDYTEINFLFLIIVGLFFIIQSNTIDLARKVKVENDLTI